jgi:hypothetical protein
MFPWVGIKPSFLKKRSKRLLILSKLTEAGHGLIGVNSRELKVS